MDKFQLRAILTMMYVCTGVLVAAAFGDPDTTQKLYREAKQVVIEAETHDPNP